MDNQLAGLRDDLRKLTAEHDALRSRAEAAEGRADGLYRALCATVRASGGIADEGLSDAFLILGVPAEMAGRKRAQEAAEKQLDAAKRGWEEEQRHSRDLAVRVNELEAHCADLRGALEEAKQHAHTAAYGASIHASDAAICDAARRAEGVCAAALAATPATSARLIRAEAIRMAVNEVRDDEAAKESASSCRGALLCIADRIEGGE